MQWQLFACNEATILSGVVFIVTFGSHFHKAIINYCFKRKSCGKYCKVFISHYENDFTQRYICTYVCKRYAVSLSYISVILFCCSVIDCLQRYLCERNCHYEHMQVCSRSSSFECCNWCAFDTTNENVCRLSQLNRLNNSWVLLVFIGQNQLNSHIQKLEKKFFEISKA